MVDIVDVANIASSERLEGSRDCACVLWGEQQMHMLFVST